MKRSDVLKRLIQAASLTVLAGSALAGPDVIVGDLHEITRWGSGTSNGVPVQAYSVGTISCNAGDTPLLWIASTNQHPVISGNMYRLVPATGRFEQIGQSWLKHGFTALQGDVCYTDCAAYPNGTRLGVHCSDPYGAGLNGDQGRLGPKWEVNAATGAYPYPYTNSSGSGTIFKRLQVPTADLQTPGALYFVSAMYIAPDDAAAGNGLNNASYRRATIDSVTFAPALVGTTQRTRPAIFAWKDHGLGANQPDPDVFITSVDVPGDGRFYVAAKATDLGGGRWRYRYSVQNLNSHRSAQSLSIPLPNVQTSSVTNVVFDDVDYHSGEPFSLTNWTPSTTSTAQTWASQTFAQNPNANALRWDTIYSYEFECAVPPASGNATIGLFRTGSPSSVTISTVIPSPTGTQQPINDACAFAASVGSGATPFSTVGATTDGPLACNEFNYNQVGNDIWFRWTSPNCAGNSVISTCGSAYDTKIAVYADTGTCPTDNSHLACNDDNTAVCGTGSLHSSVTLATTPNTSYLIRVGGYNAITGTGTLTITPPDCGPTNDNCANATILADNSPVSGTTVEATNDGTASCGQSGSSADIWFRYTPQVSGNFQVNTCNSSYDTVLAAYSGTCGSLSQIVCNDDEGTTGPCTGTLQSSITVNGVAGTTYLIRLAGYQGATGNYTIRVVGGGGVLPPINDNCNNRAGVSNGSNPFTTLGATTDGPTHAACSFNASNQITNDIWFNYPSLCDGQLTVDTCAAASFNTRIAIYSGDTCTNFDSRLLDCSDDDCPSGRSSVSIPVVAGQSYTIRVGGTNGAVGTGTLTINCVPTPPPCDPDFNQDGNADQDDIACLSQVVAGDTDCSSMDPDFNQDGNVDQDDIDALSQVVGGSPCP
ncbi:MAG: hypothetical protein SFY69_01170 [Planctomycetota bacterium]|nr:hypothetical protein [Planctomycetota bacterium]